MKSLVFPAVATFAPLTTLPFDRRSHSWVKQFLAKRVAVSVFVVIASLLATLDSSAADPERSQTPTSTLSRTKAKEQPTTHSSTEQKTSNSTTVSGTSIAGVEVAPAARAVVNFLELARREASAPVKAAATGRVIPRLRVPESEETSTPRPPAAVAPDELSGPRVPSPAVTASFQGLDDNNASIPPDTNGAVGPSHVMTTLNTQTRIQNRTGGTVSTVLTTTFWSSVLPGGSTGVFDPHILYDPFNNRWIFTVASDPENTNSSVCIGVSQNSDPTGAWNLFRFDADSGNTLWADYPMPGFNKDWIAVSMNMFTIGGNTFQRGQIYAFNKANLYANSSAGMTVFTTSTLPFTLQPARTYDNSTATLFFVRHVSSAGGTIRKSTLTGSPPAAPTLTIDTAIVSSTLGVWSPPGGNFLPQSGTATLIDVGDARMQSVFVRTIGATTSIWCAQTIALPSGGAPTHAAVQWWQLNGNSASSAAVLQQGRVEDSTATQSNGGKHYAYPSLAANQFGDMVIGYSRFQSTASPAAAYAFRAVGDTAGTTRDDTTLKTGEGAYDKDFGSGEIRWGDYSNTLVDPANDRDFWTVQEYAAAPSGSGAGSGRWGVWWGLVPGNVAPGAIQFSTGAYSVNESGVSATITATRTGGSSGAVGVSYATSNGTAAAGSDYTATSGTLSWADGDTASKTFTVPIADDAIFEGNETVALTLSVPTGGATLGTPAAATLTITDNEPAPTVSFTAASQSGAESVGSMTLTAQLSVASSQVVTVPFSLSGSAANPADYTITSSPITIAAGSTTGTITITVVNDALDEPDETVVVTMGSPTNATAGATTVHTATILDNDPPPTVSFTAASQSGAESVGSMTVTAQLSAASSFAVTVPFTVGGTASNPADFTIAPSSILIPAGATTGATTIMVVNDALDEPDETVVVTMGSPTNAALGAAVIHTATITDDDATPSVQFTAANQSGAESAGTLTITAQLSAVSGRNVTVPFTVGGTASNPADYGITPTPLTILAGAASAAITITVVDDTLDEADETLVVTMGAPINATAGATTVHTATIADDDALPSVTFTAASQSGAENVGTLTVTAQLSAVSGRNVTVPFTVGGTAANPADYTISSSPLTIAAGQTSANVTITVLDDALDEANETVVVTMGVPTNATAGTIQVHTATIADNDPTPTVTFTSAAQSGAENAGVMTVTAQLSAVSGQNVTVPFTVGGSAANPADYAITASPVTIAAGQTSASITITPVDDALDESDETVIVTMGSPTNATAVAPTIHTATLTDNDPQPAVTFTSAGQTGPEGAGTLTVTVQLSVVSGQNVTLPFTVSGTASNPADYTITASPLTILAGTTSGAIAINPLNDALSEPDETVIVTMGAPANATLGAITTHTATITDTGTLPTVQFTAAAQSGAESAGTLTVTAQLSVVSGQNVTVPFTAGGTASNPADYGITASPITILAGATTGIATITVVNDSLDEPDETVVVTMGAPANATPGAVTVHTATITDDDPAPSVQFTSASQSGVESVGTLTVTAQLSAVSGKAITVPFTVGGTAANPSDYTISSSPLTILPGATTGSVTITVTNDVLDEADETVIVTMGAPTNATLGATAIHTATISDDDPAPTVQFTMSSQTGAEDVGALTVIAQLSAVSGQNVTIPFTVTGTASIPADYTITASPIVIVSGTTTAAITITVVDDNVSELAESVIVTMGMPVNATAAATTVHTATITDNDAQNAGTLDPAFDPNVTGGYVLATAVQPDGKILIGGQFTSVGGETRNAIARLHPNGSVESSATFDPGPGVDNNLYCTAVQPDGKILLGGQFSSVAGATRNRIARLNANGTLESTATFNPGSGVDNSVFCVALQADGKNLIAGNFTSVNGQPRTNIARLNADGSVESTATFNPGTGPNAEVQSVAVQADGKILLGGLFTSVNGQPRNRIARLNADGTVESTATFNLGTGTNGLVDSVALQADGRILLGGVFTSVNGQPRNRIARLNADGSIEDTATFNPGTGASGQVLTVAVQADGNILLGGIFTAVNGLPRNHIARLHGDGSVESTASFNAGTGTNIEVASIALQADGKILLGGSFTSVNGASRSGIARLNNDAANQNLTIPNSARVQWSRGGTTPEVEQVTFELSTDGGATWSLLGPGTRIPGGWEHTGLSLPATGSIRARGHATGGYLNGSSGLVEQIQAFSGLPVAEIAVEQPVGTDLVDGAASIGFGSVSLGSTSSVLTFTIRNLGTANLSGLSIAKDGANSADFTITALPTAPVAPNGSTTFTVQFAPGGLGARSAAIHIASNDADENPFDIALTGLGVPQSLPTITSLSATSGKPGDIITINGAGFSTTPASNVVYFGSVKATVTAATTTQLSVTMPYGATYGPVTVTVGGFVAYSPGFFLPTFTGSGALSAASFASPTVFGGSGSAVEVAIGDIDGDGAPDLVLGDHFGKRIRIYRNILAAGGLTGGQSFPTSTFAAPIDIDISALTFFVSVGDLDGDGRLDVVLSDHGYNNNPNVFGTTITVLQNTSTGLGAISFATPFKLQAGQTPEGIAVADLDGDGRAEIICANSGYVNGTTNGDTVSVFVTNGASGPLGPSSFRKQDFVTGSPGWPWDVAVGDLDGDGRPEIVSSNLQSATVSILHNVSTPGNIGAGSFEAPVSIAVPLYARSVRLVDLNQDGLLDIIAGVEGSPNALIVLRNLGTGPLATRFALLSNPPSLPTFTTSLGIGDLDGDGKADVVAGGLPYLSVLRNQSAIGGGVAFAARIDLDPQGSVYGVKVADFDRDGRPDIVTTQFESSSFALYRNLQSIAVTPDADNDGLLDAWELLYWGTTAGHSAGDDFDHDGLTELQELAFGLNPTLPDSALQPRAVVEAGYLTMTINMHAGAAYEVQSAGTLLSGSFSAATTTVLLNNGTTLKVRDNVPFGTPPSRFMRVQVIAAP